VIHRNEVDPDSLPYRPLGPAHSFLRADAGLFQRYPAEGTPVWTVHRDREHPSVLDLPMRSR
jgi:hypothetical protein